MPPEKCESARRACPRTKWVGSSSTDKTPSGAAMDTVPEASDREDERDAILRATPNAPSNAATKVSALSGSSSGKSAGRMPALTSSL